MVCAAARAVLLLSARLNEPITLRSSSFGLRRTGQAGTAPRARAVQSFFTGSRRPACAGRARWRPVAAARSCLPPRSAAPPAHSARHPTPATHQSQSAPGTVARGAPADHSEDAEAAARPGPRARTASHRGAATQSGLHGQPSADCDHRRCARKEASGERGRPAGGMSIVDPGRMWPAAVLPPSRMREREQTALPGRGGRGAAAAAKWLRPPWSLRVGAGIVVAGQRVVDTPVTATAEPTASRPPRTRQHPFPPLELIWDRAVSKRARQPPRYHRHRGPDHGLFAGPPRGLPGFKGWSGFACVVVVRGPAPHLGCGECGEPDRRRRSVQVRRYPRGAVCDVGEAGELTGRGLASQTLSQGELGGGSYRVLPGAQQLPPGL